MSQTKFEFFPNEILLDCFQYLNIIHIFQSFDQLNHHFDSLIRIIPFSLNFQNIQNKFQCDQFCRKLAIDKTIKNQLYSIHSSNKNTCYPAHLFISRFSLSEFPHLRSITLDRFTENNWKLIAPALSLLSELSSFQMIDCFELSDYIIPHLPISQLHTLMIPLISFPESISDNQFSSIIHLTIYNGNLDDLFILLSNASKLNYLKIESFFDVYENQTTNHDRCIKSSLNNLKTFHIDDFYNTLPCLFKFLEQMPNLENLIITACNDPLIINASKWQNFITSSLLHLKDFKFTFHIYNFPRDDIDEQSLKEFQNDFWCKQHHWHTEYAISTSSALIYTIPYLWDKFELLSAKKRYNNGLINHVNIFDNVKDLTLHHRALTEKTQYYFSNIDSLSLGNPHLLRDEKVGMNQSHIPYLQTMIDLSNIKHLRLFSTLRFETNDVLKEILKLTTKMTSLEGTLADLIRWFNDDELCKYFNQSIQKLNISYDSFENSDQLEQFCKIFENLCHLQFSSNESDTLFLIKHLPKLTYIEIHQCSESYAISWLKQEVKKLHLDITADFNDDDDFPHRLFIWIDRN
ncbi:hypothetical protein I4U23_011438 [Adineta vaga]|nr:hypothetical protein I4U23_011438 [Adineta vaga]